MSRPSLSFVRRPKVVGAILMCALGLAACGQKGPLYLPDSEPSVNSTKESKRKSQSDSPESTIQSDKPVNPY